MLVPVKAVAFEFLPEAKGFDVNVYDGTDQLTTHAGSHPYALTFNADFEGTGPPGEDGLRDLSLEMPPGLFENPTALGQKYCSDTEFKTPRNSPWETSLSGESCTDKTQVGTLTARSFAGGSKARTFGLFNLVPKRGEPARLGASPYGKPIVFVPSIRQAEGEYGITLTMNDIPEDLHLSGLSVAIWGVPWSVVNNEQRGNCLNEVEPAFGWAKCSVGPPSQFGSKPLAYLTLPTSCEEPMDFAVSADSWQQPADLSRSTSGKASLTGCEKLEFQPQATAQLSNPRASSPSGYAFDIEVDTGGVTDPVCVHGPTFATGCAPTPVRKAVVTLPEGVSINPSVGAGLSVCSRAQYEAGETPSSPFGAGCPSESKIGDFSVSSPIVAGPITGSIYLAAPHDNPFGSLLAVYLVAKSIPRGILVKVAGELSPDPATGSLTANFDQLPQLPYSDLSIHFREGQRSPLATPPACGPISTEADLTPWRNPNVVQHVSLPASITAGVGGGPCPSGLAPFAPQAKGGSLNSRAGAYTPFYLRLSRNVAEQEIVSYSAQFPPGLLGKIAGVPYCSEAAIEAARRNSGVAERDRPSCPAASLIGRTYSGYGVGSVLAYAPGNLYLAGPYRGSPFSVVAIDSALVGPFDLGVVIVRSAVRIDPETAQASIDATGTDPIPHIIDGIPIHLRDVRAYIDRPNFTLNPTSCEKFTVSSAMNGAGLRFGDRSDDTLATATAPFQAFDCGSLGFRPRIGLKMKGGIKRGAYASLRVVVRPRPGEANIRSAQVTLPPSLFLEQGNIKTICTKVQFAAHNCPRGSVYGHVLAFTPLLEAPMEGPAYLRASAHTLPDLVFALRGHGIEVDVAGRIDSFGGGIRGTFPIIPDAPVTKFVLKMKAGKRGVLVNAENLCRKRQPAVAKFIGHANRGWRLHPEVKAQCKKRKKGGGR
ncbi:MAG: hypothetical protein QOF13_1697 [Solirubrobacterales bacterium]|jgi:hypothetical protein|nr:hypothetical protein [Solirubrobacterales bacterium]